MSLVEKWFAQLAEMLRLRRWLTILESTEKIVWATARLGVQPLFGHTRQAVPPSSHRVVTDPFCPKLSKKSLVVAAKKASKAKNWCEAGTLWRQLLDLYGDQAGPIAHLHLSVALREQGQFDAAEAAIQWGRDLHPTLVELAIEQAEIRMAQGDWPAAITQWRALLDMSGDKAAPGVFARLSTAYRNLGHFDAADQTIKRGRELHPNLVELAIEHAEIGMAQGDWPAAITRWQALIDMSGDKAAPGIYARLSAAHRNLGHFDAADQTIKRGRELHPNVVDLAIEYADLAMAQNDWSAAVGRWQALLEMFADEAPAKAYWGLCIAYRYLGDFQAAEANVNRGLARHPHMVELQTEYAEIAMAQMSWQEAIKRWRILLDVYGNTAPAAAYKQLYVALSWLGEHELAQPFFEKYVKLDLGVSYDRWITRNDTLSSRDRSLILEHIDSWIRQPRFSILMPVSDTSGAYVHQAIVSVLKQLYTNWELCIVADASINPDIRAILKQYDHTDIRIRICFLSKEEGIVGCANKALEISSGDWIVLSEPDGVLSEHALYLLAAAVNRTPDAGILYSDEDQTDTVGRRFDPYFKPDWDYDLLLGQDYISHLSAYPADLSRQVGGFREGCEGYEYWDFALRLWERIPHSSVQHIPFVLYHRCKTEDSVTANLVATKGRAAQRVVNEHFARTGQAAVATSEGHSGQLRVKRFLPRKRPLVSIVIPTKDHCALLRKCLTGIFSRTDYKPLEVVVVDNGSSESDAVEFLASIQSRPNVKVLTDPQSFNFSRLVNLGVAASSGSVCLLLNNDTDVMSSQWLDEMVSHAIRPDVGVVGAKLYYPNRTLQHGGVILSFDWVAGHMNSQFPQSAPGYGNRLKLTHGLSCVTAACLATRKEVFDLIGGFREDLPTSFNDVDFCLRVRRAGYKVIWTPNAELYHYESPSRGHYYFTPELAVRERAARDFMRREWGRALDHDPTYNPNLSLQKQFEPVDVDEEPRVRKPWLEFATALPSVPTTTS